MQWFKQSCLSERLERQINLLSFALASHEQYSCMFPMDVYILALTCCCVCTVCQCLMLRIAYMGDLQDQQLFCIFYHLLSRSVGGKTWNMQMNQIKFYLNFLWWCNSSKKNGGTLKLWRKMVVQLSLDLSNDLYFLIINWYAVISWPQPTSWNKNSLSTSDARTPDAFLPRKVLKLVEMP